MKHRRSVSVHKYVRIVCANKFTQVHTINQQRVEKINGVFKWILSHARHPIFTNIQKTASLLRAEDVGSRKREIHWKLWGEKSVSTCLGFLFSFFFLYFKYIFMGLWMYTGKKYNANFILMLQLVVLLIEQTIIERVNIFALQSVKACEVLSSVNTVSRGVWYKTLIHWRNYFLKPSLLVLKKRPVHFVKCCFGIQW